MISSRRGKGASDSRSCAGDSSRGETVSDYCAGTSVINFKSFSAYCRGRITLEKDTKEQVRWELCTLGRGTDSFE